MTDCPNSRRNPRKTSLIRGPAAIAPLMIAALLSIAASPAMAQGSLSPDACNAAVHASFDVVSVKPSPTPSTNYATRSTRDGFVITGSLQRAMLVAFGLHDFQLMGGPDWVSTATWVIGAKNDAPDPDFSTLSQAQLKALGEKRMQQMQGMLMDRFHLKCHLATKELPIYELVQAKGGAKLKLTSAELNKRFFGSSSGPGGQMHANAAGATTAQIASQLTNEVGRIVVDKTGLTESYDMKLDWIHDVPASSTDAPSGPTIFTALEEQLGLKLVPAKGPVPVVVIDAVEKPSEN